MKMNTLMWIDFIHVDSFLRASSIANMDESKQMSTQQAQTELNQTYIYLQPTLWRAKATQQPVDV